MFGDHTNSFKVTCYSLYINTLSSSGSWDGLFCSIRVAIIIIYDSQNNLQKIMNSNYLTLNFYSYRNYQTSWYWKYVLIDFKMWAPKCKHLFIYLAGGEHKEKLMVRVFEVMCSLLTFKEKYSSERVVRTVSRFRPNHIC